MGGICAGGIPTLPEINIDTEQLNELIKTAIDEIPDKVRENCENFPTEIANADPQPFNVPDTNLSLTKDTPDQDIAMAAIVAAFATQTRDAIKESIWKQVEPQIDEQLNEYNEVSDKIKQSAKDKFKENTVDRAVDAMMDEALDKMKGDN
mmetsp:Transcript_734/g.624  ORF Transcript_734/g.624 Transcript_734/m.624 type:complete len:150 (+) Transcript_734:79-528(+)